MSDESFSLDEIRSQLASLGYGGISDARLNQFQSDLSKLLSDRLTDTNSFTESAPSSKLPSDSVIVRDIVSKDILIFLNPNILIKINRQLAMSPHFSIELISQNTMICLK